MAYRIVKCRWESGKRYRMLVDAETGMPTWWPTLFVTTQLRNRGHSVSTMDAALGTIQILLSFLEERGIDLEERILTGQFLEAGEVDDRCDRAQKRRRGRRGGGKSRRRDVVSPGHHYNRLSGIATYLDWLAIEILGNRGGIEEAKSIERMVRMVRARTPSWHRKKHEEDPGLSDEAYTRLSEIIEPSHPDNPFNDEHVAIRNRLIIVNCRWESGEHYRMLVDTTTGVPLYWATLFVSTQLRNTGRSVATMEAALDAVRVLFGFLDERKIDPEDRVLQGRYVATWEIERAAFEPRIEGCQRGTVLCVGTRENGRSHALESGGWEIGHGLVERRGEAGQGCAEHFGTLGV